MAKNILTLAKELGFTTAEQYFEYCIDSYENGQKEQCKDLFNAMKKEDKKALLIHIDNYMIKKDGVYNFYFNLL